MLDVSANEFKRSRDRQEQQAKEIKDNNTRRMLLFYAVECGGKYQLMLREKCYMYSKMPERYKNYRHDINGILKELGLESKCAFPVMQSIHGEQVDSSCFQEVWRYGINCKDTEEKGREIENKLMRALELLHDMDGR